jgi:CubicO group peptidase (beta-lactamase class C family)
LAIGVQRGGETLYLEGHGFRDLAGEVPATAETVFLTASVTKMLTSAAILTLVRDGRLDLDDRLATVLPSFPEPERGSGITVRRLLEHTSGLHDLLADFGPRILETGEPLRPSEVLAWLARRPLDFEPGTRWVYSNTGYYLLGLVIEAATGERYGEYVRRSVALPLGLEDTFLCDDGLFPERRTVGYTPGPEGLTPTRAYEAAGVRTGFGAAGGFCSTASDLARLPYALRTSGLLPDSLLLAMQRPTRLADGTEVDYGLGLRLGSLEGRGLWGHTGGSASTWATVVHHPEANLTIATLVNTDRTTPDAWMLEGRVARAVLGLGTPAIVPVAAVELDPYVGRYTGGRGDRTFDVSTEGSRLVIRERGREGPTTELVPVGGHAFAFAEIPADRIVFLVDEDRVLGYSIYLDGIFSNVRRREDG